MKRKEVSFGTEIHSQQILRHGGGWGGCEEYQDVNAIHPLVKKR